MMNFFKKLLYTIFAPKYNGIAFDPRSPEEKMRDKIAGASNALPIIPRLPSGDWGEFHSTPEPQSLPFEFDTMACVTFSGGHAIEEQIIWLLVNKKVPQSVISRLRELGFFQTDDVRSFRISKRFSAITNGTTKQGNYLQQVASCYRNVGFIPDSMLPFGGKTWEEYFDTSLITNDMIRVARETLSYFKIEYEAVLVNTADGINDDEQEQIAELLTCSPIQIAMPVPSRHAQVLQKLTKRRQSIFDTYHPFFFTKDINKPKIDYALRYWVTALDAIPVVIPPRNLYKGMSGDDVADLQKFLGIEADGKFGDKTKAAIIDFQKKHSLVADGIWGKKSREKRDELS